MIEVGDFALSEPILGLHEEGLRLATRERNYAGAHDVFKAAIEQVKNEARAADQPVSVAQLQIGRLLRDDGFTHVREALAARDESSDAQLVRAVNTLGTSRMLMDIVLRRGGLSEEAIAFAEGECGASKGAVARYATAAFVLGLRPGAGETNSEYYPPSHVKLTRGNNAYYLVSNAACAARQAVLDNDSRMKSIWIGRAVRGVVWAQHHDPKNFQRAFETWDKRQLDLDDYQTAFDSVFETP